ncbi:MAG: hypothetical protein LBT97_05665 [Planctomycetota bacterium]|nr:hypothetical protein [Planctomycetota bacterium]
MGNAVILANLFRDKMAFTPGWGWMVFNGRYWEGGQYKALGLAGEVINRRIAAFKAGDIPEDVAKRSIARLEGCSNSNKLRGMLGIAEAKLNAPADGFDANPYLLNVGNGVVDLRSGELQPHSPRHFITKWSPVEYNPNARSHLWDSTVTGIACEDAGLINFFRCLGGYAASGDVSLQMFFYFYGEGANGKSLMTDLWAEVLGGFGDIGYAVRLPNETVLGGSERPAGAPSPDLLALKGKRLALLSEQDDARPLNAQRIKDLTGGDAITARAPHREATTFPPTHTMICCGNHIPLVNASDHGFWRRLKVVPFKGRFKPSRIGAELRAPKQLSAILAWMVRGATILNKAGLNIPDAVENATWECRNEAEPLRGWIEERCEQGGEENTNALFGDFAAWRTRRQEARMSQSLFSRALSQMGYAKRKSNGNVLIVGLSLRRSRGAGSSNNYHEVFTA